MSKRALIVAERLPKPGSDDASRRILDHVDFLAADGWALALVAVESVEDVRFAQALEDRGVQLYEPAGWWLDELLAGDPLDIALVSSWQLAELYGPILRQASPATRMVVDSRGLQFLHDARRNLAELRKQGRSLVDPEYGSETVGELSVYADADAVLTSCAEEAELINYLAGARALAHAVPYAGTPARPRPFEQRRGILFVGSFRQLADIEGLEHLCEEILPRIDRVDLERHPVWIVGDGLQHLSGKSGLDFPGVRLAGSVPSLVPYIERARVSVSPLLFGEGSQPKVVDALIAGIPVVSKKAGVEGLGVDSGQHVVVADDPGDFASAISELLRDPELWARLATQGREYATASLSRAAASARLLEAIEGALKAEAKPSIRPDPDHQLYERRSRYAENRWSIARIREALRARIPDTATVLVVSDGSTELLKLGRRRAWHFPQGQDGSHAAYYRQDSEALIEHLEELRARGADHLLFPRVQRWWLSYYPELRDYLDSRYEVVVDEDCCLAFTLRDGHRPKGDHISFGRPAALATTAAGDERVEPPAKLIAFYLPQFHPIPENDKWWGEGFTEWTNVGKAEPLFPGHEQPRLPADLGFYDLRLSDTRQAQADLAREYRIHGFCYYHYWFGGKRLLERPFEEVLVSGEPDLPFCLCWANEPWSRRWDGTPRDVLQPQSYSDEDDLAHIAWLLPALGDPRAIRVEGRPVFLVYNARSLPDPARTADTWRREVRRAGEPGIYLIAVETSRDAGWDATRYGFDAKLLFQPRFSVLKGLPRLDVGAPDSLRVYDYQRTWPALAQTSAASYRCYDAVCPRWDNTPRTGENGLVLHGSTPEAYEDWLSLAVTRAQAESPEHRLVFINAWNEWAEGCHLEPDVRHGRRYLEATRRALETTVIGVPAVPEAVRSAERLISHKA